MKAHNMKPGMVWDCKLIIATDPNRPFFSVEFHRLSGGGRHTFMWEDEVFIDYDGSEGEVVDAEVYDLPNQFLGR